MTGSVLIHDVPSCGELVTRIMNEADTIIRGRPLGRLLGRKAYG